MKSYPSILTLALALGLGSGLALRAQTPVAPAAPPAPPDMSMPGHMGKPDPAQMVQRLDTALQLTADQKTKITAIATQHADQLKALREDTRTKQQALAKDKHAQIRALLTPEQQTKFDALPSPKPGHKNHQAGGPLGSDSDDNLWASDSDLSSE